MGFQRSARILPVLAMLAAACGSGATTGTWQGVDVHLVDGHWVGTEHACGDDAGDLVCRTIVERASAALPPELGDEVTRVVVADLPTTFLTDSGETRTARLAVGIQTRAAVVVDLIGGTRRVIGLWCYLPSGGAGDLEVAMARCRTAPIDDWRDGHAPPSIPPGTSFG